MRRSVADMREDGGGTAPPGVGLLDSPEPAPDASEAGLEANVALAFAPLHKRAFGIATGVASALTVFVFSVINLLNAPDARFPLGYLGQYFFGYTVSWPGAFVGAAWGFAVGFVAGWFVAFCRNIAVAIAVFTIRTRAELTQTRDFLDHI